VDRQKKRLARLEEEAGQRQPAPVGRRWPSDLEEERALRQGWEAWLELMASHGWSEEELEKEIEWTHTLHARCFESGFEDWQVVGDWAKYIEATGSWHGYPGPRFW
jgi:hypothetical protein